MKKRDVFVKFVTVFTTLITAGLVILQLFMPALRVGELAVGGAYEWNTYNGIDTAFICWPAFILGGELIGPNAVLIAGIVLSVLLGLLFGILLIKTEPKRQIVYSGALSAVFLYFGICWLNIETLVMNTAYAKFEEIVYYAKQNNMYGIHPYAIVVSVVAIIAAVANLINVCVNVRLAKENPQIMVEKRPMSNKVAVVTGTSVMAFVLVLAIVATTLMNQYAGVMNNFFGQGKVKTTSVESADYYNGILETAYSSTKEGSKEYAEKVNEEIVGDGITLLKNEDEILPLSKGAKVILFGADTDIADALIEQGMDVTVSTVPAVSSGLTEDGFGTVESYNSDCDAAIVTIYRQYGEGNDAKVVAADGIRTELSLSEAELNLLDKVCQTFDNVVVLLASCNVMETSWLTDGANYIDPYYNTDTVYDFSNIKGALWITTNIGESGAPALADILDGTINPSGHLTDTWISNFKYDPTFANYGDFTYTNGDLGQNGYQGNPTTPADGYTKTTFVEYEEGIYSGYRYYETAAYEAQNGNYEGYDYDTVVTYPFGFGLSYTSFSMEYEGTPIYNETDNAFELQVKVTNDGETAGKEVVQIYVNAPYIQGETEKAHVVLAGFAKTGLIEPGKSEVVTVSIDRDYICTYDYKDEKCYILDEGDYHFILSENAHSWYSTDMEDSAKVWTYTLDEKIIYDENNKRVSDDTVAVNQMDEVTNWKFTDEVQQGTGYAVNFSRSNFAATFPTAPVADDYIAQDRILKDREKFNPDDVDTYIDEIVITDSTMTSYTLADMRGVDYDDEKWNQYIEQFSEDKLIEQFSNGNWQEVADTDNGVPRSVDLDGPAGLTAQALGTGDCQSYQNNILIGATWNTQMAAKMGTAIANEMMAYGWTGWYGPGMNIHRSPFCGRNTEYYSEDAILSGMLGAAEVAACAEGGVICYNKHFAINNQEVNRQGNICTWVNEQAAREVYLRGWEIYVKECTMTVQYYAQDENGNQVLVSKEMPGANGIMTSYNLIGAVWAAACDEITVDILREEWGFTGTSLTDAINNATEYMDPTAALYSGATDLCLSQVQLGDTDNDLALLNLQKAAKNVLYNKANSNILQISGLLPGAEISYGIAPWQVGLICGWIVAGVTCIICIVCMTSVIRKNKARKVVGGVK